MSKLVKLSIVFTILISYQIAQKVEASDDEKASYTIAFGSCNKHNKPQPLWDPILENEPDLWIWTGDIVYADANSPKNNRLDEFLTAQKNRSDYSKLRKSVPVIGGWDDHDYGKNNGGKEHKLKYDNKKSLLKFFDEPADSPRWNHEGIYTSYDGHNGDVKVLVLDARFNREAPGPKADILGEAQWSWLENQLNNSKARVNIITSGIQILPKDHRFEKWAEFPKSRQRLIKLIHDSKAKGVLFISGDRHLSEISKLDDPTMSYPLIDITSSGMTHSYSGFKSEYNELRVGKVFAKLHFGIIKVFIKDDMTKVYFEIRDKNNIVRTFYAQEYPL